jgi:hypothetical protein
MKGHGKVPNQAATVRYNCNRVFNQENANQAGFVT